VDQGAAVGKAQEEDPAGDLPEGILDLRQVELFHLPVIFRNVVEIFGVFAHALKERVECFLTAA